MDNISKRFVSKLYIMSNSDIPDAVLHKAKICFVDYLACVIGASNQNRKENERFLSQNGCDGNCHIFGMEQPSSLQAAVMINAFQAHLLELDDSHRVAMTHLGAPIFSALLGVAEVYHCSLPEIMRAAVIGYEAAIRLANTIQPSHKKRGFHVSGTCCTVGCAMGIASMLKYTETQMQNVFSAAVSSAAGLLAVISGASQQKPYNIANAAVAGTNAALYGVWFNGATDILGDSRGFFHAVCDEYKMEHLFEEGYAIEGIYQKQYAACRHCHAPMEAMLQLDVTDDRIRSVEVKVYDLAINGHDHTAISGVSSAKQSIPYGVAVACVLKNCGQRAYAPEILENERVMNLIQKVKVVEDPVLSSYVPQKRAARVVAFLDDGTRVEKQVDYPKGEPENPLSEEEIKEKFIELVSMVGTETARMEQLMTKLFHDAMCEINELFTI